MLIGPRVLSRIWNCVPDVVVHIGGHEAEELEAYSTAGWGTSATVWIEALENKASIIRRKITHLDHHSVHCATLSDVDDQEVRFFEANNGQSSSMLQMGTHSQS